MDNPETIELFLFGPLSITRQGEALALPPTLAARSLLVYLLLNRQKEYPRAVLAGTFWPEASEEQSRRALSQALWQIGRSIPKGIQADGQVVRVSKELRVWSDIEAFMTLLSPLGLASGSEQRSESDGQTVEQKIAALRQAIQLYRGDFLEGWYDNWALFEQERLREIYLNALHELCRLEKLTGHYGEALQAAQQLATRDPLNEAAQREVMRLFIALQRPEAALKQYETLCNLLKEEMAIEPEEETTALVLEIAQRYKPKETFPYLPSAPPPAPLFDHQPGQITLLGRQAERSQILTELEAMLQGKGRMALIEGEAGVGKTRLVQEAARDAEWRNVQVLWGNADPDGAKGSYAPLIQALNQGLTLLRCAQLAQVVDAVWLQALRFILPALGENLAQDTPMAALAAETEHERMMNAFGELLQGWSQIKPVALIMENLHWFDADSLHILNHLLKMLPTQRLLILVTCQSEARTADSALAQTLDKLLQCGSCQRLSLAPLDAEASGELVRRFLGLQQPAPAFENRLYQEARGNPLFLIELLRGLHNEGLLYQDANGDWHTPVDDTTLDYGELPLPKALEQSIARHLENLEPQQRGLLQAAAVLGSEIDLALLSRVTQQQPRQLFPILEALVRQRFLVEDPTAYIFAHNQMRQFIYQTCSAAERKRWHQLAGEAIQAGDPERCEALAFHFTLSENWPQAVEYHHQAAKRARKIYALHAVLEHTSTALRILDTHTPFDKNAQKQQQIRFDLLAERQISWWIDGKTAQQQADLQQLLNVAEHLDDMQRHISALIQQATFLCNTMDDYEAAQQTAGQALKLSQQLADRHAEANALELLGMCAYFTDHYHQAMEQFYASGQMFRDCADETAYIRIKLRLGRVHKNLGQPAEANQAFQEALDLARNRQNEEQEMYALTALATMQRVQGDYLGAIQYNETALAIARRIGHRSGQATLLDNLGIAYWTLREYGKALQSIEQALEILRRMGDRRGMVFCLLNLGSLYLEIGVYTQAQDRLEEALRLAQEIGFRYAVAVILLGLGLVHLETGRTEKAWEHFEQAQSVGLQIEAQAVCGGAWAGMGRWHLRQGKFEQASGCFTKALECHEQAGEADYATADRSYLAFCHLQREEIPQALELSSQAIDELEARPGGEEVMCIYLHHILILQANGQTGAAGEMLQRVYGLLQAQAATLPDTALKAAFLEHAPANHEICQLYGEQQAIVLSGQINVLLPSAQAPSGRPLRPEEWVRVNWTVSEPSDGEIGNPGKRRQQQLRRLLHQAREQGATPTVENLAKALGASRATVKRDLAQMRRAGEVLATRGHHV